jgi:hypothetical protein
MGASTNMYPNGIGAIMPNSVQNATTIRNHGNQSVTHAMQAQLITPKNNNVNGILQGQQFVTQPSSTGIVGHGAMIQGNSNRMLNQVIKKHSINSGRTRGQMNSTTLRQEGANAGGRMIIKKTVSPSNESFNAQQSNQVFQQQSMNSQQSHASGKQ